ncbi:MAG: PepSY-associated TM helix domain-containing protein [Xanthomonadales bacterium]|nr:hypothetical protein [Xanthomonadales bacterium]MCC6592774.1 PepSY-associated TM helix domain-containing protein [Xanthomonadales bacterium]MCE7932520.1 hypothetical protein [Xanthomonadales bacterium PRO6]
MSPKARAGWLKLLHRWHWISAALCLVGMLAFAITGITLNHAGQIGGTPQTRNQRAELSSELLASLRAQVERGGELPPDVRTAVYARFGLRLSGRNVEWSADEIYVSLPRPGGDGWLAIDLASGGMEYETTERGWIAWFNDLHKGRHTGAAWSWFIDLFAIVCLVFCLTGLCLLQLHARQRTATWPTLGLGLLLPLLLILLLVH